MFKSYQFFKNMVLSLIFAAAASGALAAEQKITTDPSNTDVKAGQTGIALALGYSSTDN
jgi:hypothetical protein